MSQSATAFTKSARDALSGFGEQAKALEKMIASAKDELSAGQKALRQATEKLTSDMAAATTAIERSLRQGNVDLRTELGAATRAQSDRIQESLGSLDSNVRATLESLDRNLGEAVGDIKSSLETGSQDLTSSLKNSTAVLEGTLREMKGVLSEALSDTSATVSASVGQLDGRMSDVAKHVEDLGKYIAIINTYQPGMVKAVESVDDALNTMRKDSELKISELVEFIGRQSVDLQQVARAIQQATMSLDRSSGKSEPPGEVAVGEARPPEGGRRVVEVSE